MKLFLISAIGNMTAMLILFYNWKKLKDRDTHLNDASRCLRAAMRN